MTTPLKLSPREAKRLEWNIEKATKGTENKMETIEDYPGKCFRHHLRFKPNESFDNKCPACWWEREARSRPVQRQTNESGKDGPVYLKNIGGGTFVEISPPEKKP